MQSEQITSAVKKLIADGFNNLKVISFEFDIPIEQLWEYKREIEQNRAKQNKADKLQVSPVKRMREKYDALCAYKEKKQNSLTEEQIKVKAEEERRLVDRVIKLMEEKIAEFGEISTREKYNSLTTILREVTKIKEFTWSDEQSAKMVELIEMQEVEQLKRQEIKDVVKSIRRTIEYKLAEVIRRDVDKAGSVKELEELSKRVKAKNLIRNPRSRESVLSDIQKKISLLRQREAVAKIRNDFSEEVRSIILRTCKWEHKYRGSKITYRTRCGKKSAVK